MKPSADALRKMKGVARTLTDVAQDFMAEVREGTFVENVLRLNASHRCDTGRPADDRPTP